MENRPHDLVQMFRKYFSSKIQPENLAKLMEQYNWRTTLDIKRDDNVFQRGDAHTLKESFKTSITRLAERGVGRVKGGRGFGITINV